VSVAHASLSAEVPPQNLEAEEAVLGAMLLSETAIGTVTEILSAEDFYRGSHGTIYRTCLALWAKGEPVDAITLANELEERGELEQIGGASRVAELAALVSATANVDHYAAIVKEDSTLRALIQAGQEIARLGRERIGETTELVDRAEQIVFDLSQQRVTGRLRPHRSPPHGELRADHEAVRGGVDVTGVPSGFRDLDRLTSGFQPGNLVILAARPSMGKSALGLCIAANLGVRSRRPSRSSRSRCRRPRSRSASCAARRRSSRTACAREADAGGLAAADGGLRQAHEGADLRRRHRLDHDDGAPLEGPSPQGARAEARADRRRLPPADDSGRHGREPRPGGLADLAQPQGARARPRRPILALSQLSRAVEQRADKKPMLSDLRESGSIEQDADLVLFVYRDDYYNGEESDQQGLAELILAKHRNGPTDAVKLSFLRRYAKFTDLAGAAA
jgi:replicative DNA helicase